MKAKPIALLFVALFVIPALADECTLASLHANGAAASATHAAQPAHAMAAQPVKHDAPDVGGADAYKTQSGKREPHDSIDAWLRGG